MGNEPSLVSGIDLDERAVEVTDYWTLHNATLNTSECVTPLSVFQGETVVQGQLWKNQTPLEKASKCLMLHRHPCILKYVSSWRKNATHFLAVEPAKPLSLSLASQGPLQICLGLRNILRAVAFLHEQADSCHNNICLSSIYLTNEGSWKLGGLEYLCRVSEMTQTFLDKSKPYRYSKGIDPNESKNNGKGGDQYAFSVLAEEVLRSIKNDDIPHVQEFKEYCCTQLKHPDTSLRPVLSAVLLHPFFIHDFISVHSYLNELPLKTNQEKNDFFEGLLPRLKKFDETIVASNLGDLLISRMVLLDKTAQERLVPFVLRPRNGNDDSEDGLFSEMTFRQQIAPKLKNVFCVRDSQIRLVLLSHFHYIVHMFNSEELKENILPELLVGIKDTNDYLVSETLHCLAELVPLLGSTAVIGGHRARLFTDGRPYIQKTPLISQSKIATKHASILRQESSPMSAPISVHDIVTVKDDDGLNEEFIFTERPSPDGEEVKSSSDNDPLDNEAWSDWENDDKITQISYLEESICLEPEAVQLEINVDGTKVPANKFIDITELDIKHQKMTSVLKKEECEIDFFQDMEPVIQKANLFLVADTKKEDDFKVSEIESGGSKFNMSEDVAEEGWGDDLNDWDADD